MEDPREAIATAEDTDSLRRAYASAIATTGARGDAAEFRRLFLARRDDLGAPSAVDEVEESDRAFGRWSLRCFSGEESETTLRTELDAAISSFGERDPECLGEFVVGEGGLGTPRRGVCPPQVSGPAHHVVRIEEVGLELAGDLPPVDHHPWPRPRRGARPRPPG